MTQVVCIEQILPEVLAQAGGNIAECAAATAELLEVEIDAYPFVILALRFLLDAVLTTIIVSRSCSLNGSCLILVSY